MIIRRMGSADIAGVCEIEKRTFSQPWSKKSFSDAQKNADAVFFVAEEPALSEGRKSAILGYIGMYVSFDEGEITNVAVDQPFRGAGIGKALVGQMLSYAKNHGIARIVLEVRVSNTFALRLYEAFGFVKVGERKGFYSFPKEDAGIMVWEFDRIEG